MKNILQEIFHKHDMEFFRNMQAPAVLQRIASNESMLTKDFNKWQRKMMLRITDDNDELSDSRAKEHFMFGVQYDVKFMIEVLCRGGDDDEN